MRRDRAMDSYGGVCLYIKNDHFKYQPLDDVKRGDNQEILWAYLKPARLSRDFSCLAAATMYHPKQSTVNDNSLWELDSLTLVEARYSNCALVICGDFNRFNTQRLTIHFRFKQIVKAPTRKDATLDLIILAIVNQEHFRRLVCQTMQQRRGLRGSEAQVQSLRNTSSRETCVLAVNLS